MDVMADVTLRTVVKRFGDTEIIKGVSLDIRHDEFVVFVGPSGCGKSTLLRLIAGLEDITSGEMYIDGQSVNALPPAQRGIAMVFQSYALYPHMTIRENIGFGLKQARRPRAEIAAKVQKAADILQITHLLERKPKDLSGGQRQRVAIGRAIVRDPKVFLFDEPLSNLDASLRVQMRIEIAKLKADLKTTMIYVTHDQVEAMTLADKIVVLRAGQVEQVGAPLELYHHPRNQFVAGFIGSPNMNFIPTALEHVNTHAITMQLGGAAGELTVAGITPSASLRRGESLTLGVRPEHLVAVPAETRADSSRFAAILEGRVFVAEHLGGETYIYLKLADQSTVVMRAEGNHAARVGDVLHLGVPVGACHVFEASGQALLRVA
jgi:multiple sugar transport system ATP-binding protein